MIVPLNICILMINSWITKCVFSSDLDDDLNESLYEMLSQSNESLEKMYQQDMEEKRAKMEDEEKKRKEEEAEVEINNQERDGEEEMTFTQAVKWKKESEELHKQLERATKIRLKKKEAQKIMEEEQRIMEEIEKLKKNWKSRERTERKERRREKN